MSKPAGSPFTLFAIFTRAEYAQTWLFYDVRESERFAQALAERLNRSGQRGIAIVIQLTGRLPD